MEYFSINEVKVISTIKLEVFKFSIVLFIN
jgi:hypothetical protein